MGAEVVLDLLHRAPCVDPDEAELVRQAIVLLEEAPLVAVERLEDVGAEREIHPRLPVVHALARQHPRHQVLQVDLEVEDEVGDQRHAEELARPTGVRPHHGVAREGRVHVAVGDHDEARLERRDDLMLEPVCEVGGVQQAEGGDREVVPRLRLVDRLREERRAGPAGVAHRVALDLEPRAQHLDLRRPSHAVGPLDHDQVAG